MSLSLASITYVHGVAFQKGIDQGGPYYQVQYHIDDWTKADQFANALIGVGTGKPHRYPAAPNFVACTPVTVKGRGRLSLSADGTPSYLDGAVIDLQYRSPGFAFGASFGDPPMDDPGGAHQIDPSNPITWCTQELDFAVETLSLPNTSFVWNSDSKAANVNLTYDVHITTMSLTFYRRSALPMGLVRSLRGRINSSIFLGAATETVLFVGGKTSREASTDGSVTQRVTLLFKERDVSWNKFMRPDTLAWDYLQTGSGTRRFATADLRPLIAMP